MQGSDKKEREFERLRDLAQRTGLHYRTLHRAVKAGKIRTVRLGGAVVVPKREVERILAHGF